MGNAVDIHVYDISDVSPQVREDINRYVNEAGEGCIRRVGEKTLLIRATTQARSNITEIICSGLQDTDDEFLLDEESEYSRTFLRCSEFPWFESFYRVCQWLLTVEPIDSMFL